jgi:DNA repair protein RadC
MIDPEAPEAARAASFDDPRARLRRLGPEALSEAELLGLLLERGRSPSTRARYAARVLDAYGGARSLFRAGLGALSLDLGASQAERITAALELSRRALSEPLSPERALRSSQDVLRAFDGRFAGVTDERVIAVLLDVKQRPVAERAIAIGGPTGCAFAVRELFALAVREGAAALVLVHNHPSGDPSPSDEDRAVTAAVARAGRLLSLPLVDHVIVSQGRAFSFLDAGLLDPGELDDGERAP